MKNTTNTNEIAITFDDLPGEKFEFAETQRVINGQILQALKKFQAPAIGFVNEGWIHTEGEAKDNLAILKSWVDHGQHLGNHTYSHPGLSGTSVDEFKEDIIRGGDVSKKLMTDAGMKYRYFRHPFLDTGRNKVMRSAIETFLTDNGYIIAPITINTDDWMFNAQLLRDPQDKEKIIALYLEHTRAKFAFYKAASIKIFGRNIKHTFLLHVNLINACVMEDILKIIHELDYTVVTLDRAMEDPVYLGLDNYCSSYGASWLYRWDFTRGKAVDWTEDPIVTVDDMSDINAKNLIFFDNERNRIVPIEFCVDWTLKNKAKAGIITLPVAVIEREMIVPNADYASIAHTLAEQGYFVATIQHAMPGDKDREAYKTYKPICERGVENILFALTELKRMEPNLDMEKITLVGNPDGGDISAMFATLHPELVAKVISP
ncbi:MAG: polysaccharide deacetylase family protein [Alphaproteobacteria bacterium]|nr:polysaccharide deacetylase family protein [Alphaproteobacteria bacterium]